MAGSVEENPESTIKEAVRRFIDERWQGHEPDIDEFVGQYPGLEHQIRKGIKDAQRIDALFDSLAQADEIDFEETAIGEDLVGRTIGNFEIEKIIGRGGMGVVYLARDTKLKRLVAIKSMPANLETNVTARTRFKREAELLASLNHPNIAVIYEIIDQDNSGYLILEYAPGETLAERMVRELPKLNEALSIGQQIADAILAAHKKGIIHRDLKPSNIKITSEGRVKVLDFGLAKSFTRKDKKSEISETQPGRVIGTPAYMSPEQARGQETDHRTDIWSFGCILFQMLTGHLPFKGQTATDTLASVIEREPDWDLLPKETPTNIRTLLRRCLEKDTNRRLDEIEDVTIEIYETLSRPQTTATTKRRRVAMILSAATIVISLVVALRFLQREHVRPSSREIRLVVLPFENLGLDEDEYFAAGITDAITARLAVIRGLSVISRQSAMQYKHRDKNIQQIAEELDVDYILEGTIQRERRSDPTSRVRIIPQLIQTSNDIHIWAQTYDDDMNEVFEVQTKIAEQVAQALDITLLEPERKALASRPTENVEAYEYYLHGNDYFFGAEAETNFRITIRMYEKAIELDPAFALAYTRLAEVHTMMYWFHYDRSDARIRLAKQAVDKAFELDPDLPEVHLALGWYYYLGHLDYDRALEEFAIAQKSQPNDSDLLLGIGGIQRRKGNFQQALAHMKKADQLNPRSSAIARALGDTYMLLRKYPEAERYYDRAISLSPDWAVPYARRAYVHVLSQGDTEKARAVLEEMMPKISSEDPLFVLTSTLLYVFDRKYEEALAQLSSGTLEIFEKHFFFIPTAQLYALINGLKGNRQLEQMYYESARNILESKIWEDPKDSRFRSSLGIVYAGLGLKDDAIREGKRAVELLPISKDAWFGVYRLEDLARIYTMVGEYDLAIEQIKYLLSIPGELTIPLLQLDPAWAPLRDHTRFQKLLESAK